MGLSRLIASHKAGQQVAKTECGACPECGQQMDHAGFGYCRCMNAECPRMGKKEKPGEAG